MAVDDPQLRYATHTEVADGNKTDFEINFVGGYINPAHVLCISVLVHPDTGLVYDRQVHLTEIISTSGNAATVRVAPAVAAGRTVIIFRSTPKTAMLVQYLNGSILSKENLELANKQLLMLIQEMLDNTNENSLTLREAVENIIDLNTLIEEIYRQVLELLASGGIISVEPRVWEGVGDGETLDWAIPGAEIDDAGFYDTYVDGLGIIPNVEYSVLTTDDPADTMLHFETPVPEGVVWFTVLRGYAKPYAGPPPITALDIPIYDAPGPTFYVDEQVRWGLIRCTAPAGCEVTIKEINPLNPERLNSGSYFSLCQKTFGQVTVTGDPAVTLQVPGGCIPATRAVGSIISAVCEDADSNIWILSGDLAQE